METEELVRLRLLNQGLLGSTFRSPAEVVGWMGAMQGQDYPGAKWAVGLRLPGSSDADVERSIEEKKVLRSWVMRGTLQLVAAEDIHWMLSLLGARIIAGNQRRYRELELDEKTLIRSNNLLAKALQKEKSLTRSELLELLNKTGISTAGQRGVYMLQRASLDRLIFQGVARRNNASFFLLEGFPMSSLERQEALVELTRRYFASRGPATLQDFIWWSGLGAAEARAGLDSLQPTMVHESVEGTTCWWANAGRRQNKASASLLLPPFDEYLIAYRDRSAALGERKFGQLAPGGGMPPATVVLDGKVCATWKRTFKKDKMEIFIQPYEPLVPSEADRVAAAGKAYGHFLGQTVKMG